MRPAPSVPSTSGKCASSMEDGSLRSSVSQTPTPAACTSMSTSCGPGCGTGRVCRVRTSGGPNRSMAAARIVVGTLGAWISAVRPRCGATWPLHRIVPPLFLHGDPVVGGERLHGPLAAEAPDAGVLLAAEGGVGLVVHRPVVHVRHASLQPLRDAQAAAGVAA